MSSTSPSWPINRLAEQFFRIEGNTLVVQDIDILDGTPLLDIKPYIQKFDAVADSCSGWLSASEEDIRNKRSDDRFK